MEFGLGIIIKPFICGLENTDSCDLTSGELKLASECNYLLCQLVLWWLESHLLGSTSQCSRWWVIHWWSKKYKAMTRKHTFCKKKEKRSKTRKLHWNIKHWLKCFVSGIEISKLATVDLLTSLVNDNRHCSSSTSEQYFRNSLTLDYLESWLYFH